MQHPAQVLALEALQIRWPLLRTYGPKTSPPVSKVAQAAVCQDHAFTDGLHVSSFVTCAHQPACPSRPTLLSMQVDEAAYEDMKAAESSGRRTRLTLEQAEALQKQQQQEQQQQQEAPK